MIKILKNKIFLIVTCFVVFILTTGLVIGNVACITNFDIITSFICGTGVDDDSEASKAARSSGNELAAKVEEEGAVLLKNENNSLPINKNTKVNVFGAASTDSVFIPQGTGSGTGSRNDYVTFMGGLKEVGLQYNETLAADYSALDYRRIRQNNGNFVIEAYDDDLYREFYGVVEAPNSFYNDTRMTQAKNYSDTAIVVLGRLLGEGNDYSKVQYIQNEANDTSRKLQTISAKEEFMLEEVCNNFDNVIVVLNTSNPMELGFIDTYDVDSAIYMGLPGTRGTIGLANLLIGKSNPSGKTVDTWAYDLSTAASYATSGREGVGSYTDIGGGDATLATRANKYSDYIEDIYIGYKWYETADAEKYWSDKGGYDKVVQFPFGYGLSYTNFDWVIAPSASAQEEVLKKNGKLSFDITVTNRGNVAGMDVVQLYYSAPYTKGGIEKSVINLGAFAKTALLKPGEFEKMTITFDVETMKSYDAYDKNNNGFMGYELEGGKYTISFRTDVHNLAKPAFGEATYEYEVPAEGFKYDIDSVTKKEVKNQFTTYTNTISGASSIINEPAANKAHSADGAEESSKINYMTRADFKGTFPKAKPANRAAGNTLIDDAHYVLVNPKNDPNEIALESGSKATSWQIDDLFGVEYGDPLWDELVSQLPLATKAELVAKGGFGTIAIPSINKPGTFDTDGPSGFNNNVTGQGDLKAVNYPSATILGQTWNWFMAYQVGMAIGLEAKALNIQGWYGPGANLHRSPTGGRNFEYYSEDPRLSGIMCAYEVLGAKEKGLTAYIKHIAVNDSESGRNGAYKWVTEQSMRENYFLPFELAVKVGKSNGMMSSVDRIGSTRASGSYALLTSVLREEWGFNGTVITDFYQNAGISKTGQTVHDVDECVRAGNSQILFTSDFPGLGWFNDQKSATAKNAIHKSAKDILFAYADTLSYSENALGLDKGSSIGKSVEVFPWWVFLLVGLDVTAAGLMGFWVFMAVRSAKKKMAAQLALATTQSSSNGD